MSDLVNLLDRVSTLDKSPQFDSYSKVVINIDDETQVSAGNDLGRTLEFDNPFGTQAMANQILNKLRGFQYQPWNASGALLDPAAEIGDAISVRNVYGGLYTRSRTFSRLMKADVSAPHDEEINHEYKFETPDQRKFRREMGDVRATLTIQSDAIEAEVSARTADSQEFRSQLNIQSQQIAARVTQTGGSYSSFGWSLLANEFGLYSGNQKVFYVNSTGAHVQGEITATSGKIGNFNIGSTAIWNNISQYGGTQTTGVYLGTNGIQLGQKFRVDTSGNVSASGLDITGGSIKLGGTSSAPVFQVTSTGAVTASNLTITGGSIKIGGTSSQPTFSVDSNGNLKANNGTFGGNIYAKNIKSGGSYGTFDASGLTDGTITSGKYKAKSIDTAAINTNAITTGRLNDSAVTAPKIGMSAVTTPKIKDAAVTYDKSGFQGTLDQVGVNKSNIETIYGYFTGSANFSWLNAAHFALNGKIHNNARVQVEGSYLNLVTWSEEE